MITDHELAYICANATLGASSALYGPPRTNHGPPEHRDRLTSILQIAVEPGLAHSEPPLFAHEDQCKHGQRHSEIDKGKSDPGVLKAHLGAQFDGVETDAETKDLAPKIEQGADLGCLLSIAL